MKGNYIPFDWFAITNELILVHGGTQSNMEGTKAVEFCILLCSNKDARSAVLSWQGGPWVAERVVCHAAARGPQHKLYLVGPFAKR